MPKSEIERVRSELKEREKLEKILDNLMNQGEDIQSSFSKRNNELTGYLMSGNTIVAKVKNDKIIWKNTRKCPLILLKSDYLTPFLLKRVIDSSRPNSRLIKKAMNISKTVSEEKIPLIVHGAVITDNYWFRPSGSNLVYQDIKFKHDTYFDLSLKGDTRLVPKHPKKSPQITLIGSYEKCWKLINKEWWLYKVGTKEEIFSEVFASKFAEEIGVPTAFYEQEGKYIRTKNLAEDFNFEPMSFLAGEDDSYENVFNVCRKVSDEIAMQYIQLAYFDALIENVDRHNENLGFLRDKRTGKILALAPNFDNNLCLIARTKVLNEDREHYGMLHNFVKFLKTNSVAFEFFKKLELVEVNSYVLKNSFNLSKAKVYNENIANFLINGYKCLKSLQNLN